MHKLGKNLRCRVPVLSTVLTISCSTGLQTASAGGTGSVQTDAVHMEENTTQISGGSSDAKSNESHASHRSGNHTGANQAATGAARGAATGAATSAAGIGVRDQASVPVNIAGSYDGRKSDGPTDQSGLFAIPPQPIGGSLDRGNTTLGEQPIAVINPPGTGGPATNGSENIMAGGDYVSSELLISCSRNYANRGFFWDGSCRVVTPNGTALDIATETTTHSWSIATPPGCNPLRTENADPGLPSYLVVTYIRDVPESCLNGSTVRLQAVMTNNQQRIMLTGALVQ
ncbi:MAG: hypothetical protein FJ146_08580 [Deltaproteobacteria bacterium]|nr:hypothetical protein [Deltaproteobacteria bacterium]